MDTELEEKPYGCCLTRGVFFLAHNTFKIRSSYSGGQNSTLLKDVHILVPGIYKPVNFADGEVIPGFLEGPNVITRSSKVGIEESRGRCEY